MNFTGFVLAFSGLVVILHIRVSTAADFECGKSEMPPSKNFKIVGGDLARNNSWPWACALVQEIVKFGKTTYRQFCGCTIIDKEWVMTAGHCAHDLSDAQFLYYVKVYVGEEDLNKVKDNPAKKFNATKVIVHKKFVMSTKDYDIALVKLDRKIDTYTEEVRAACLPTEDVNSGKFPETGTKDRRLCYVGGWGHTFAGEAKMGIVGSGSDKMRQTPIEIYPHKDCKFKLPVYTDTMFCGGYDRGGRDSCQGDSGGPMVCEDSDRSWTIHGVVSWGTGCARAGSPGVYTNVNSLKSWIKEQTGAEFQKPSAKDAATTPDAPPAATTTGAPQPATTPGAPPVAPTESSSGDGKMDGQTAAPVTVDPNSLVDATVPPFSSWRR